MTDHLTKESKYKCDHDLPVNISRQLDLICRGYLKAMVNRHNLMLEFVKEIANDNSRIFVDLDDRAIDLLKEIGEWDERFKI